MASLRGVTVETDRVDPWTGLGMAAKGALALSSTFIAVGLLTLGPALPALQSRFAATANAPLLVQLIGSVGPPAFALASPFAGRLIARHGIRAVYQLSLVAFLILGIAPAATESAVSILALRILLGFAVAGVFTAGMAGIGRLPERQRHTMYGLSAFFGSGIAIAAYQLVGALAAESWRFAFLVNLLLLPAIPFAAFLPRDATGQRGRMADEAAKGDHSGVSPRLIFAAAVIGWAMVASSIYSPFYLTAKGITDPRRIGLILAVMALASLVASGLYGPLQRGFGTYRVMLAGMFIVAVGCLVLWLVGTAALAPVGLGIIGFGMGASGTAVYAFAVEQTGPRGNSGAATGMISFAIYLPQLLFPVVMGGLGKAMGPAAAYAIVAILLLIGAALLIARRTDILSHT